MLFATTAKGQNSTVKIDPTVATQVKSINDFIDLPVPASPILNGYSTSLISNKAFNDTLHRFFNSVSGQVLKAGQVQSTSAILDDKSLTLNYSIPFKKIKWFSIQPTATGTSTNGIINVFTGNKFGRTLTFGSNFNFFIHGSGNYYSEDQNRFLYYLKDARTQNFQKISDYRTKKATAVAALITFDTDPANRALLANKTLLPGNYANYYNSRRQLHAFLDDVKEFFPVGLDTADMIKVQDFVDDLNQARHQKDLLDYVRDEKSLTLLDSLQNSAPFTHFNFLWLTLSPKLNQKNYPIYDAGNVADTYTRTESDYYFSVATSVNYLKSWKKFKLLLYPGIAVQNARIFNQEDSISLNIESPFINGGDSLKKVKSTGFYPSVAARKWAYTFTFPIMLYWTSGWGIDAGIGYKIQPAANDFNTHLGVFFSIPAAGGGDNITLEPLIKYDSDKSMTYAKNFDKFTFGFSVSFALPTYLSGK
jgi:hypothetical protein